MNKPKQTRRIPASKLRRALADMAEEITNGADKVLVSLSGNTFHIHLDGGTINITINEEGGER